MAEAGAVDQELADMKAEFFKYIDESDPNHMHFCWFSEDPPGDDPPSEVSNGDDDDGPQPEAAVVFTSSIWEERHVLRVYFKNGIPSSWTYTDPKTKVTVPIDTKMVLEWANVWSHGQDQSQTCIPIFKPHETMDGSDIRVMFCEEKKSWSYIGNKAEKYLGKVTMELDLSDAYCDRGKQHSGGELNKRSLVIHEFGHALGLEHEHQRPEFWDKIGGFINGRKMKEDVSVGKHMCHHANKANYGKNWYRKKESTVKVIKRILTREPRKQLSTEYDPMSIMHYGFNKKWLWDPRLSELDPDEEDDPTDPDETDQPASSWDCVPQDKRPFLKGLLERFKKPLADDPSDKDKEVLYKAYPPLDD